MVAQMKALAGSKRDIPLTGGIISQASDAVAIPGREETAMWVLCTPEVAKAWHSRNIENNRVKTTHRLALLSEEIENDRFLVNGDTIRFDRDGNLVDGQHRTERIAASSKSIWVLAVFNISKEAVDTIDKGKPRSAADTLKMHGKASATTLAAIINAFNDVNRPERRVDTRKKSPFFYLEMLEQYPELEEFAGTWNRYKALALYTSVMAVCFSALLIDREDAEEFIRCLTTGAGLEINHPCLLLREKLLDTAVGRMRGKQYVQGITAVAWNHFRRNSWKKNLIFTGNSVPDLV